MIVTETYITYMGKLCRFGKACLILTTFLRL